MQKKVQNSFGQEWKVYANYPTIENGRIWVYCKQGSVDVTILETSAQLVHCAVQDKDSTFTCWTTFVYGFNTLAARRTLWDHLRHTGANCQNPG